MTCDCLAETLLLANELWLFSQDKDCLTPLHWAIMSDQAAHVKMLLNTDRVDVSMQDSDGRAALNYAVLNFSPSCIRVSGCI